MNAGEIELGTLVIVIYQTLRNVYFATRFGYLDFETGKWDWELVPVVFYRIFGDKGRRWWFEIGAGMDLSIDAGLAWKLIESKKLELIGHTGITASPHGSGWYLGISIEF